MKFLFNSIDLMNYKCEKCGEKYFLEIHVEIFPLDCCESVKVSCMREGCHYVSYVNERRY